jgi:gliding motility-associated-like protein
MRYNIFVIGIVFILLSHTVLKAQQIDFRCTEVDAAGDITLSWSSSGIPAGYQYEIYFSTSKTGTYTLVGTTSVTNFIHVGANGGMQQCFYVIKAVPVPPAMGTGYVSDTIASIYFYLDKQGELPKLTWERPTTPPLDFQSKEFTIYKQRNSVWNYLWATQDTLFIDTVHICWEKLGFRIHLYDTLGKCESKSIVRTDLFTDKIAPTEPQLDSVSINPATGKTELGWNRSPDVDVLGYIIYTSTATGGPWIVVDTIMGADTTFYIDNQYDANNVVRLYRVASIDTCLNASPMCSIHNTMLIETSVDKCDSNITLSWNAYSGMPDSITGYQILVSINGGAFVLLDNVSDNQLVYVHKKVVTGKYVYIVRAYNSKNGYSGTSAKTEVNFVYIAHTGDVCLRYVSVVDNSDIEIVVFAEDTINFRNLFLYKSSDNKTTFSHIDTKSKTNGMKNYTFTDNNVDVQQHTYFYAVALTDDECDNIFACSDTGNNIVLEPKDATGDQTAVKWKPYYGFDSRLDSYDIHRKTQIETMFQFMGNVSASQLDYTENVSNAATGGGKFYYQIVANENNANIYGFRDKSYSNIVEIRKEPVTYIPNAFCPNSQIEANRVFKPVNSYVDIQEYVFSIYDRWGSLIFTTNDINTGWDGTVNGQYAASDIYAYILSYRIDEKTIFKKQGHVTLIR